MTSAPARDQVRRVLGIDVGGSAIKLALIVDGTVATSDNTTTPRGGPEQVVQEIVALCQRFAPLDALGVAVPAVVDPIAGVVSVTPNLPGNWAGFALGPALEARAGQRVVLANDARCFALGELRLGSARGCRDVIFVTLGTGVGGAIAVDGEVYLGSNGLAGELGHQTIDPDGPLCGCGNRGCIETVASGSAVVAEAVRGLRQGVPSVLRQVWQEGRNPVTAADVAMTAAEGDTFAAKVIARAAHGLGIGLANLSAVLAPERIVIGGGFGQALGVLLKPLEKVLAEHLRLWPPCPLVGSPLGISAGAVGAALWAMEHDEQGHHVPKAKRVPAHRNTPT